MSCELLSNLKKIDDFFDFIQHEFFHAFRTVRSFKNIALVKKKQKTTPAFFETETKTYLHISTALW